MGKSSVQNFLSRPWQMLGILIVLAIVMRVFSMFKSVLVHDESTYILIADALLEGQVYLRDVVDTKPIGIFALFALFQSVFGDDIIVIRLMTTLWIALTGFLVYKIHDALMNTADNGVYNPAPAASGIIYVIATSIFTHLGISPNTEQFFNLFTVAALYLIVRNQHPASFFFAGLLLGLGYMIKYVVAFDALAFALFFTWRMWRAQNSWTEWLLKGLLTLTGISIPFLGTMFYYHHLGMSDRFDFFSFQLSGRYVIEASILNYVTFAGEHLLRYLPLTFMAVYALLHWRNTGSAMAVLGLCWGTCVMIVMMLPGRFFAHYFIHFLPVLSLVSGGFFDTRHSPGRALAWIRQPVYGYSMLSLIIVLNVLFQKMDYLDKPDMPKQVADYLNDRLQPGDKIYTGNYHQIIYHLTDTESPTPYVHPSLIWYPQNSNALDISPTDEWQRIVAQQPRFIIMNNHLYRGHTLSNTLRQSYRLVKTFSPKIRVYERK